MCERPFDLTRSRNDAEKSAGREMTLIQCCIGSRAAFAKLRHDRLALSTEEFNAIIARLDEVLSFGNRQSQIGNEAGAAAARRNAELGQS